MLLTNNASRLKPSLLFSIAIFLFAILCLGIASAQETEIILGEIQVVPNENVGKWTIGGQDYFANKDTVFDFDHPAKEGFLTWVEYASLDGQAFIREIKPQSIRPSDVNDGPYVFWKDSSTAEVVTIENGAVQRRIYTEIHQPLVIDGLAGLESTIILDPTMPVQPKASWKTSGKMLVISDLEGHYENTLRFLQNNGVLDDDGKWQWGDGHLVLNGDLVDRGLRVAPLMCMLQRLEREARVAGGQVHYILGNHEAMIMNGDLRYVHPINLYSAQLIGVSYDKLFAENTQTGRWLRSKNSIQTIGDLLFVHAGYSPNLDAAQLSMETLNDRIRHGLAPFQTKGDTPDVHPVRHREGPLWYRGHFDRYADRYNDGKPTFEQVAKVLTRHQARHIIVGHSVVDEVGPLDESGQVIAVDVKWKYSSKCQGLLVQDQQMWRLDMTAEREEIHFGALQK